MSKAFLCDNCKEFVAGSPATTLIDFTEWGAEEGRSDYCMECKSKLGIKD